MSGATGSVSEGEGVLLAGNRMLSSAFSFPVLNGVVKDLWDGVDAVAVAVAAAIGEAEDFDDFFGDDNGRAAAARDV